MDYVLDILQGAGLALACGVHPLLPVLLAGALASADLGLDFEGTAFAFLEEGWFLLLVTVALVAMVLLRARLERGPIQSALIGVGIGFGALLCAASLDDRHGTWWYGILIGIACAALAQAAARDLFARVRPRLDPEARAGLPVYAEGAALLSAGLTILFPPLAIVVLGFLAWLVIGGRRRAGEKYAGLRILR
jgi:Domain of unknown function (DUF4126)